MRYLIVLAFLVTAVWTKNTYTNALIYEDSPYLRQHAHNPVDWYPWGKEALSKAKQEGKLIFLSIGYSTCHWCHVMEEESFEDKEVAALLNRYYISIKVDREQLPQIDKKYQQLFKSLNGRSGGWPLSVFLTPEQKPFYVTTYIPKEEGYGSTGMINQLSLYAKQYHQSPKKINKLQHAYEKMTMRDFPDQNQSVKFDRTLLNKTVSQIEKSYDPIYGGFAKQPKFPEASKIALLLDIYHVSGNSKAWEMAKNSLTKMAQSGLYDQVSGGFFRYATDRGWQIPHFEKMLYTSAELIPLYVKLYQCEPDPLYLRVVRETIAEMDRHYMQDGLYFSASDADSDGEEGGYFLYRYDRVLKDLEAQGLGETQIKQSLDYLGIEEDGNIDGDVSHLHITSQHSPEGIDKVKSYLGVLREERTFPFVDHKIITAWNAMMVKALFTAGRLDKRYISEGAVRLNALLALMSNGDRLYHQALFGKKPKQAGLLEDYAFMVDTLIEAQQVTHDMRYLHLAEKFSERALTLFYRNKRWYLSSDDVGVLADTDDKYYTSPLSVMLLGLTSISVLSEDLKVSAIVGQTLENYGKILKNSPASAPKLMSVFLHQEVGDIVIKSNKDNLTGHEAKINAIDYPFVLTETQDTQYYLACKLGSCFARGDRLEEVIDEIEAEKEQIGKTRIRLWK